MTYLKINKKYVGVKFKISQKYQIDSTNCAGIMQLVCPQNLGQESCDSHPL